MKNILLLTLFISFGIHSFSQSKAEIEAYEIGTEAILTMDNGDIDKAINMLKKAKKLDPNYYIYPYEIGYAYYLKKDYKNAIKTLENVLNYENINAECFALLGNVYDVDGKSEKAIEIYKKGLEQFPNSGRLYFEQGIALEVLEKYNDALQSWENGIAVAPYYPSNYHKAAIYYSKYTTEKLWGIMYGELFMNMERGSAKTEKISKLLFDTYKSAITITSETEAGVSFSKAMTVTMPSDGGELKFPFSMPYEMTMVLAVTPELKSEELGIQSFSNIRTAFIKTWYETEKNIEFPNIIFDWHKKLIDLGYFEAYNYWLLMQGNGTEFDEWLVKNEEKFNAFIAWFSDNPFIIDENNKFHRLQYE